MACFVHGRLQLLDGDDEPRTSALTQVIWPRVVLICGLSMMLRADQRRGIQILHRCHAYPRARLPLSPACLLSFRTQGGKWAPRYSGPSWSCAREQFHNARVGEFLDPLNPAVQTFFEQGQAAFVQQTGDAVGAQDMALDVLEGLRQQQAASLAYFDAFWLFAMLALVLLPLVFFMKPSAAEKGAHIAAD